MDERIIKHAEILINWCTDIKRGDKVLLSGGYESHDLIVAIMRELGKIGAFPITMINSGDISRSFVENSDIETLTFVDERRLMLHRESDVIISISAPRNNRTYATIDRKKFQAMANTDRALDDIILTKRWCLTVHPCNSLAQESGVSFAEYQDFVYDSVLIDWNGIVEKMKLVKDAISKHGSIRYIGNDTDLYAETKNRLWVIDDGKMNMPGGEICTSPVENKVEGKILFDIPILSGGIILDDIRLVFEKGEIVDFSAGKGEDELKHLIETDEGSKRLGEIAIGMNPGIQKHTMNILFDEKMYNTIHCAIGNSFDFCNGVNKSNIHVDMIKDMKNGEIYADDELIYSKGKFFFEK